MRSIVFAVSALMLAGCTAPTIPDTAIEDRHEDVAAATLFGWTEPAQNFTRIIGYFDHAGSGTFEVAQNDPHGAWNLTILGPDGRLVIYDERPTRKPYYETVLAPFSDSFTFTWLHDEYERYEQAGVDEDLQSQRVNPGNYTAILQFTLAFEPDDAFEVNLPITVS